MAPGRICDYLKSFFCPRWHQTWSQYSDPDATARENRGLNVEVVLSLLPFRNANTSQTISFM